MSKGLGRVENKILLYFNIVTNGCKDYIDSCEYTPYYCGDSEAKERTVDTCELCLFVADIIKCPGEIEKHFRNKHNDSIYKSVLRAITSLERKGYIERKKIIGYQGNSGSKWFMIYKLIYHRGGLINYSL
jgi:hypothetical protein